MGIDRVAGAALAVASLLATGCGSSDGGKTDASSGADALAVPHVLPDGGAAADDAAAIDIAPMDGRAADLGPAPDGAAGAFRVEWQLVWVGGARQVACEEARVVTVVLEGAATGGGTFRDEFPCGAGSGVTEALPHGPYSVRLSLVDAAGLVLGSQQGMFTAGAGTFDLGTVVFELQSFQLSWTLKRAGRTISCADANASTVVLQSRREMEPPVSYQFPCPDGMGVTTAILPGSYAIDLRLIDTGGRVLWKTDAPVVMTVSQDRRAVLPGVTFTLP
jgi:hypothetical protein